MFRKYFTLQEANKRLPLVRKIVQDILQNGKKLRWLAQEHQDKKPPQEYYNLASQIEALMLELEDLGCFYKDWNFEMGLVDFPALIEGKEVFLCWRSDEPEIRFFHPIESGYAGRLTIE